MTGLAELNGLLGVNAVGACPVAWVGVACTVWVGCCQFESALCSALVDAGWYQDLNESV